VTGTVRVAGEAAEVARAEAQAVLALVQDGVRRQRLAAVVAAVDEGELEPDDAEALAELLELGLQSGRIRSLYGPGGEQASLALYRKLPQGRELVESATQLNEALGALAGRTIDRGEYGVTILADGLEVVLRLGRAGARLATIGA
jgi:hypothetical protein